MLFKTVDIFGNPSHMVMDPVHGGIQFFSHERDIINHPSFQRLRHIKQNDVLHLVFPGANHSRFEHSIGAMHVAGRIFQSMLKNYFADKKLPENIEVDKGTTESIQYCYACLRAAALLHDTGHFPFSHQFESSPLGKKLLCDSELINDICTRRGQLFDKPVEFISHEHVSIVTAHYIMNSIENFPVATEDVISIMEHGAINPSERFINSTVQVLGLFIDGSVLGGYPKEKVASKVIRLFKDVISGEIDADKMDYLLRDSYYTGCNYGIYNIDHVIRSIYAGFDTITNPMDPWIGITIHKKGIGGLEDFVYSRFRMYLQVYNHKTAVGFKWILQRALAEVVDETLQKRITDGIGDPSIFKWITDDLFMEKFRAHAARNPNSACRALMDRKVLNFIRSVKTEYNHVKERVKRHLILKHSGKNIVYSESSSRFSKIKPSYDKIRILSVDKTLGEKQLEAIAENSNFFEKFEDITEIHYYIAPNFYSIA